MPLPIGANPLAYMASPANRSTHGARLYWVDDASGKKSHIAVDAIPSLEFTQSSTVTQFPVQDGTVYSDHIIHFPDQLKLEIVQTNDPFEDVDPSDGSVITFGTEDRTIETPATRFFPTGLLFATMLVQGALATGANAIAGLAGFGGFGAGGLTQVSFQKPPNVRDRINEVIDSLTSVRLNGRLLSLDWLGRFWTGLAIETFSYRRTAGTMKGAISLTLTQVNVTTTDTATLAEPAELRLKPAVNGGSRQATTPTSAEKSSIEEESALHKIFY